MPTEEDFAELVRRVNALTPGPSAQEVSQRQQQASAEASALREALRIAANSRFNFQGTLHSSAFTAPPFGTPAHPSNPFPRPPGTPLLTPQFDIAETTYGAAWGRKLGFQSGFYRELESWTPIVSNLWDLSAALTGLLSAQDTPDETILCLGNRLHELHSIIDQCLRRIRVHELRASRNPELADAYSAHLALSTRHTKFLPPDLVEFDASAQQTLQKDALKRTKRRPARRGKPGNAP